jgi:hypothetical protein
MGNSQIYDVHETLIIFLHKMQVQDYCHGVQEPKKKTKGEAQ